ncbi:uncharacterized protein BDW70DRAFT_128538 [Aspergillus foveolatus]|uniref:uncharacterized protein n=1 Tax=Aspergillus foveolatus TaxID=210207 RepID=UPI003CCCF304
MVDPGYVYSSIGYPAIALVHEWVRPYPAQNRDLHQESSVPSYTPLSAQHYCNYPASPMSAQAAAGISFPIILTWALGCHTRLVCRMLDGCKGGRDRIFEPRA